MKKIAIIGMIFIMVIFNGCSKKVPVAKLSDWDGTERIETENIIYENVLEEKIISWDNCNIKSFD